MSEQTKQEQKIVIWSKQNCPACVQAKSMLQSMNLEYEERMIGDSDGKWVADDLRKSVPGVRSVPQIFIDDVHIGGFPELKKHLL